MCAVDGCLRPAARSDLCWTHLNRVRRGRPVTGDVRPRNQDFRDMVREAAYNLAEVDSLDDDSWTRAWARMRAAMRRFVHKTRK